MVVLSVHQWLLDQNYSPKTVESTVLEFWERGRIYDKVREVTWKNKKCKPVFAFLEGPPTANGFMHVGHARGRTLKDVKLRFARMKGYRVWDQAGWDTQGLPVELEVEKRLGFRSKKDIENFGVERFIQECQKLVDHYLNHWEESSSRLGLWLDYRHAYQTRHPKYIETVWEFLKQMWENGVLYEDVRVIPRCPKCQTALSSHEVTLGYREVDDHSVYFKIKLADRENTYLIAWTTTPWTVVMNEAVAVHPEEVYITLKVGDERWILAEKRLKPLISETGLEGEYEIATRTKGEDLKGIEYEHPLKRYVSYHNECELPHHTVLTAEWVSMDEGTGIVHTAPAHGPEDFELAKQNGLRIYTLLNPDGFFSEESGAYRNMWFRDASRKVVEDLREEGLLVYAGKLRHTYPFCWRCDAPLIYHASRQWFLDVESFRDKILEELRSISGWKPAWAYSRMADWIENARDWCISRERYWGTPLPVWSCRDCGNKLAVSSLEELRKIAKNPESVAKHHRPWIDRVVVECPECGADMVREPFVVDVWLDSGVAHTASLNQYGYARFLDELYPYTWITEAADQTRGWFYTLLVTGVMWYGKAPYRAVLLQGHVLDEHGRKMSKSRGNVIWALEWMEKHGADPMRIFLLSRSPWDSINFDQKEVDRFRSYLNVLWNCVRFAAMYMSIDGWKKADPELDMLSPEDRWIIYELYKTLRQIEKAVESDSMHQAVHSLVDFTVEKLSHRYIPVIRSRIWEEEMTESKNSAYATLHYVLTRVIKAIAPVTPFLAEYLHQAYTKSLDPDAEESVHLSRWPKVDGVLLDSETWRAVNAMFELADKILAARNEAKIKRRWPLRRAAVIPKTLDAVAAKNALHVIAKHANIKEVELADHFSGEGYRRIEATDADVYVLLEVDKELYMEGLAKEIIRRAQVLRKKMNLNIEETVERLEIYTESQKIRSAIERYRDFISSEVRVRSVELSLSIPSMAHKWKIEGDDVYLLIVRK